MIKIKKIEDILKECKKRKNPIINSNKILLDDEFYLYFATNYEGIEVTPDIVILGYEDVLNENRHIEKEYRELSDKMWVLASTGQGDHWLLDKKTLLIKFHDHDRGEFDINKELISLNINFEQFLQMAFLFKDIEHFLEQNINIRDLREKAKIELLKLEPELYENYPFGYFE